MSTGSQRRQTPVKPSRCNQEPVTRNGGKARAITAIPINHRRQRESRPFRNKADPKPSATASSAVSVLTSRLFLSRVQFIEWSRTGVPPVEFPRLRYNYRDRRDACPALETAS